MRAAYIVLGLGFVIVVGAAGYWAGRNDAPRATSTVANDAAPITASESDPVLYYRDPDGKPDYSETPRKTADGRDFIAVRASGEAGIAMPKKVAVKLGSSAPRRILYYRNPMGLPDTSPLPKKDSMGMDYIPVYDGGEDEGPVIKIAPGKLQRTGVVSEAASLRVLQTRIRAPGTIQLDEHRQTVVALRFDAFIEKLEHVTTGSEVQQGEPMMRLYSPALSSAAAEYLSSLRLADDARGTGRNGSRRRLDNLGLPDSIIKDIEQSKGGPLLTVTWPAPRDGVITEHNVVEGMRTRTGDVLFRIADVSVVWALTDIAERDLSLIALGQTASVTPRGYPGKSFTGKISMIYPAINKETRTARVRIELVNPDKLLLPDMYVDADIATGREQPVLSVRDDAVIDSGTRKVVILDRGEGRFEPCEVKTGRRGGGYVEITGGLAEGDKAVTSANFLLDAESNLRAALQSLAAKGEAQ